MTNNEVMFAGVCISSGRKPITFAVLKDDLNIAMLAQWEISEVMTCLKDYGIVRLAINFPNTKGCLEIYNILQEEIKQLDFEPYPEKKNNRVWIASSADECYRVFQSGLLSRRTLEGRIQRSLVLYEEGLQIDDPMDFFEEITRHKLLQGVLPTENIYSSKQLDALVMAYVAWLAGSPSEKVFMKDQLILPKVIENG